MRYNTLPPTRGPLSFSIGGRLGCPDGIELGTVDGLMTVDGIVVGIPDGTAGEGNWAFVCSFVFVGGETGAVPEHELMSVSDNNNWLRTAID